jgi:hypothetical protein
LYRYIKGTDEVLDAAARLTAGAPPPSDNASQARARGNVKLSGRTGYVKSEVSQVPGRERPGRQDRFDSRGGNDADSFYGGGRERSNERSFDRAPRSSDPYEQDRKSGDWDCPDCGFMNFASRSSCFKCGPGEQRRGPVDPYNSRGSENRDGRELREGDWKCDECGGGCASECSQLTHSLFS